MGLFDFLGGKTEKKRLEALAQRLGGGEVVHKPNDHVWEWRGSVAELRARVQLGGARPEATIAAVQDHGSFSLARDPALVKDAGESPDDAWSGDDAVRLFVGPGTYLESFASSMPGELAAFSGLPEAGAQRLVAAMPDGGVQQINAQRGEVVLRFDADATTDRMATALRSVAGVFAVPPTSTALSRREAVAAGDETDPTSARVKCGYCHCVYLLGPEGKCPNCGGPAG